MLLRRLLLSSRHLRLRLQTLTPTTTTSSSSSSLLSPPLHFRFHPTPFPSRFLSPRLLSTSGRDGDGDDDKKPWSFTPDAGDPDPFAHEDAAAAGAGEVPLGSDAAGEDLWAKGMEDGERGDVFEEIYKEAAAAPAAGQATPAGGDELWTLGGEEEEKDDPFAAAVLGEEGAEGIGGEDGGLELDAGRDDEEERQQQERRAREQELTETLKGDV